ncbi:MAG: DUF3179 domain-containing protein [Chloroflexi bacterium]|nr:DUF3179 domain-containing protein [Chloroflexota bacterium]
MHDRRLDGETLTFGNQGRLWMKAMTWWDHGTESIWSQPWGTAIAGPLEGTALTLIPASIVPWSTWINEHPETTVVANDLDMPRLDILSGIEYFEGVAPRDSSQRDDFVIGVALGESAAAYRFTLASELRVINDRVGEHPVAVFVDPDTRSIHVFLRTVHGRDLDSDEVVFELDQDGRLLDVETGSVWNAATGEAIDGPLSGAILQPVPWTTSFVWAWRDFFPHTRFYGQ